MAIFRVRDGIIKRVYMKELTQKELDLVITPKTGPNAGKQVKINDNKTHKVQLEVEYDGKTEWFAAGTTKINKGYGVVWQRKVDEEWITVNPGAKVDFKAKENGEYNANIQLGTFDVIENGSEQENVFIYKQNEASGVKPKGGGTGGGYQKKDFSGVAVGHSINCGLIATKYKYDVTKILEASKNAHSITMQLQEEYGEQNPQMSQYDRNAAVGHSVLNAFRIGGKKEKILENARKILNELVPPMTSFIKGEEEEPEEETSNADPDPIDDSDVPF